MVQDLFVSHSNVKCSDVDNVTSFLTVVSYAASTVLNSTCFYYATFHINIDSYAAEVI